MGAVAVVIAVASSVVSGSVSAGLVIFLNKIEEREGGETVTVSVLITLHVCVAAERKRTVNRKKDEKIIKQAYKTNNAKRNKGKRKKQLRKKNQKNV